MDRAQIETKVRGIFQALFDVEPAAITSDSSPDTIDSWDSMQHLNLVTSVEEEFGIALGEDQVVEMLSFGLIVEILMEQLKDG